MPATVLFLTGEIVILRNDNCLVKNKVVKDTESAVMRSELGSSSIITSLPPIQETSSVELQTGPLKKPISKTACFLFLHMCLLFSNPQI